MPMQDCGDGGKKWGNSGKCYTGPDAARKAYAQGMAMGDVSKAEFEGLWGPFTKEDLTSAVAGIATSVEKYNPNHDDNGRFSNLDHVPDSEGKRFTLGDAVKHRETGRIGMVTETHPDKRGKNHEASVLFGDREGIFRSNINQAVKTQRVPTGKLQVVPPRRLPIAAAERCQIFKDWAQFDAERGGGSSTGRVAAPSTGRSSGGLVNHVAGILTQAGHAMQGGRNRNGFMLRGGGGGGGGSTTGKGRGGKGRVSAAGLTGRLRQTGRTGIKGLRGQRGLAAVQGLHKDDVTGGGDNPESVRVSYRGKDAPTAIAAAHNTLHHAGLDSQLHQGPFAGPHLHVGPQSQQAGPTTYGSIGDGVAQDIESGVKPDRALVSALHTAGVVRDSNNPSVDVDQQLIDGFVAQVQAGADPAELAQQIISYLQGEGVQKGDLPGHDFRGNQHTGGASSETGPGKTGVDYERLGNENAYREGRQIGGRMGNLKSPRGSSLPFHQMSENTQRSHIGMPHGISTKSTNSIELNRLHSASHQAGEQNHDHGSVSKQQPSATDVHVNAAVGAVNPGRMHKYVDDGSGRCEICNGVKDQGIHKGESMVFTITAPVWIDKAEEKHIAYGVALHPGLKDSQGDTVTVEDIEDAAHRFMIRYREAGVDHVGDSLPAVQVVESYLAPQEMRFTDNTGREHLVLKGSWVLGHKHNDETIWQRVKKGVQNPDDPDALGSLSIQGSGIRLME